MRYIISHTSNNCTFYNIHKLLLDKSLASLRFRVGPAKRLNSCRFWVLYVKKC